MLGQPINTMEFFVLPGVLGKGYSINLCKEDFTSADLLDRKIHRV